MPTQKPETACRAVPRSDSGLLLPLLCLYLFALTLPYKKYSLIVCFYFLISIVLLGGEGLFAGRTVPHQIILRANQRTQLIIELSDHIQEQI